MDPIIFGLLYSVPLYIVYEPRHVISNNVAFWQV